ncbi:MAG TPA: helix-turn-helix transcriptional regulator [Pseudonocardiaceae bacterium]
MATSPTVRRRRLAAELRRLREQAGMTVQQVADQMGCTHPKISRIENGHRPAALGDVHMMLSLYGVTGPEFDRLMALARDSRKKGWWHSYLDILSEWYATYVGLEAEAKRVRTYEAEVMPGLLQTEDYARAITRAMLVTASDHEVQRRVELRMQRQQRLVDDDPIEVWAVVSEAVLRRPVGGHEVMRRQLEHLAKLAERPNVTVQVLPFAAGAHPAMAGPFVILEFPEPMDPDVVYLETQVGGLYLEESSEIDSYRRIMEHLCATATDPAATVSTIRQIAKEL